MAYAKICTDVAPKSISAKVCKGIRSYVETEEIEWRKRKILKLDPCGYWIT